MKLKTPMCIPLAITLILLSLIYEMYLPAKLLDLEGNIQNFILETKKIEIPGHPDAFNPCIMRWQESLLMSFRIRDPENGSTNQFGLVWLDDNFNPSSPVQRIIPLNTFSTTPSKAQDPRMIHINDRIYVIYSDLIDGIQDKIRRVFVAELQFDGLSFSLNNIECFLDFDGDIQNPQEKNWVPFDYNKNLFLAYSINPHRIFKARLGSNSCDLIANSSGKIRWDWGILRGGTPALKVDDKYLAFFHSCKDMVTTQSRGKRIVHYFMGAYTFATDPPFNIKQISPKPIIGKNFYNGPEHQTWKPLRVVFPCGFVFDNHYIWVSYGRQDHEMWVVKLDKKGLLDSLVYVSDDLSQ